MAEEYYCAQCEAFVPIAVNGSFHHPHYRDETGFFSFNRSELPCKNCPNCGHMVHLRKRDEKKEVA